MVQNVILRFRGQPAGLGQGVETYQADVVAAPGRGWGGPFQSSGLNGLQIKEMRELYRGYVNRHQQSGDPNSGEAERHLLRLLGNQLFEMLPETVQQRLRQAGFSLALTLQFEPSAYSLLDLPWELLHDPAGHSFYALQGGGLTRQLLPALSGRDFTPPQAMLGLWAAPAGLPSLTSRQQFEPAPGRGQQLKWLEGANSLKQLQQALDSGLFDGLHLVAHGQSELTFNLGLSGADDLLQWLDSDRLATLLSHYPRLQLLYLDVCESSGQEVNELVAFGRGAGLPALILMQDKMGQEAAGQMAQAFYQVLGKGATVGEAVTAGRRAIRLQGNDPIQWSIPALYTCPPAPKSQSASPLADWVLDQNILTQLPLLWLGLALLLLVGYLANHLAMVDWASPIAILGALPYLLEASLLPITIAALTQTGQAQLQEKYQLTGRSWLPVLMQKYFGACFWSGFIAWLTIWLVWAELYMGGMGQRMAPAGKQALWFIGLIFSGLAAHLGARQAIRQNLLFLRVGFVLFREIAASLLLLLFGLFCYLLIPVLILGVIYFFSNGWTLSAGQIEILFIVFILFLTTILYLAKGQ